MTANPHFNGPEYQHEKDCQRLTTQIDRVRHYMLGVEWRTLDEISSATGDPVASVSAQLRHLRKDRFGSFVVDRRSRAGALYEYRVTSPKPKAGQLEMGFSTGPRKISGH